MHRNMRSANYVLGLVLLVSLGLSLAAGGDSGVAPASAAAPYTQPRTQAPGSEVLVIRVYFRDRAERDRLAVELGAEEVATTGGFLTVITDRPTFNNLLSRGLRVEIDKDQTRQLNDPNLGDTFYSGYKTVEDMQTFLDQKVAAY